MSERPHPFGPDGRNRAISRMSREDMDVLVIGGGITGAGIARDAALRGLRVALLEKEDFGFGTSGRSSKIIHGGVRYLQYGQFLLVRESARERAVLRRIAPHLVHPLPFLYPVFGGSSLLKIRLGMILFDLLAGSPPGERSVRLSPAQVRERLPGLRDPLKGAIGYPEFITDDARLTMENALSAALHGAAVANHAPVVELVEERGRLVGVRMSDAFTGRTHFVRARVVVNATGPWVAEVLASGRTPAGKPIVPSRGSHVCFSAERLPIEGATFLTSSAGRQGLAMRRGDRVYVGTTDEEYRGPLERPTATREEVETLVELARDCFPERGLTVDDVLSTWAGIRPLILQEGKSTRDTSRKDELWVGPPNLISIAGGKLTTYRRMAERVMRRVEKALGRPIRKGRSAEVPLPGVPVEDDFRTTRESALREAGVGDATVDRLFRLYGRQIDDLLVLGREDPAWLRPLGPGLPALRGEARLAGEREMAGTLEDFMNRRAALLLFADDFGRSGAEEAAKILGRTLGWDERRTRSELREYEVVVAESSVPPPAVAAEDAEGAVH